MKIILRRLIGYALVFLIIGSFTTFAMAADVSVNMQGATAESNDSEANTMESSDSTLNESKSSPSKFNFYDTCITNWTQGLKNDYPDLTDETLKSITKWYCNCANNLYAAQPSNQTTQQAQDFKAQTFKICMPYAVLRDSIDYHLEQSSDNSTKPLNETALLMTCVNNYPGSHDNKKSYGLVYDFCSCASKDLLAVKDQRETISASALNDKISSIAAKCA